MKKVIGTFIAALSLVVSVQSQAEVAVVVAADSPVTASPAEVSRLFLGKLKKFSDGTKAQIVYAKEGAAVREEFDKKALGKSPSQIKAYWSKLLFSGKGSPPKELASDAEIKAKVASGDGFVGYIDASAVDGTVKVLTTY
jgi:hypothetical protein